MQETLKRLAKLTTGYSIITLVGPLFTIFLTPLYTRVLDPADYGVVDVIMTLSSIIGICVSLSLDQALNSLFFQGDETYKRNLVTTALRIVALLGSIAALLILIFAKLLAQHLFGDESRYITICFLSIILFCGPIYSVCATALRLRMGVRRVNALGFAYLLTLITLNITLVLVFRLKATGIIIANAGAYFVGALAGLTFIWQPLKGIWSKELVKPLLKTGLGMFPSILGLILLANADRLILTQYVSPEEVGLYAIANKLSSFVNIPVNIVMSAWLPLAIEISGKSDAPQQFARVFEYFLAGACTLALTIGVFTPEIIQVFARPLYAPAAPYAAMLMAYTGPILSCAAIFSIGLYAKQQTHRISWAYYVATPLNIVINFLTIGTLGIWGAVIATLASGIALAFVTYKVCQHIYFVPYRWLRTSSLIAIYLILLTSSLLLTQLNLPPIIWKVSTIFIMGSACFILGFLKTKNISRAIHYILNSFRLVLK